MATPTALPKLYQGVDKGSFGYKLLANLGWQEGQGLVRAMQQQPQRQQQCASSGQQPPT